MNAIVKKLNEAHPDSSSIRSFFWEALGVGGFIFLFLYLFQPFGLGRVQGNTLFFCAGFGLITFAVSLLFNLFLRFVVKIDKEKPSWTLGKWIVSTTILISLIAVSNHLYLAWIFPGGPFHVGNLLYSFFSTFAIGIFPVIFVGLFNQIRFFKKNLEKAKEIQLTEGEELTSPSLVVELPSSSKKQALQIPLLELLYIEAMQNYVLVFRMKDGELKKELIRTTLSQLEGNLPEAYFYRCHRSYLVNLSQIQSVEGNAQGLKLFLKENPALSVPVSRNRIKELKNRLSQKSAIRP